MLLQNAADESVLTYGNQIYGPLNWRYITVMSMGNPVWAMIYFNDASQLLKPILMNDQASLNWALTSIKPKN